MIQFLNGSATFGLTVPTLIDIFYMLAIQCHYTVIIKSNKTMWIHKDNIT